MRIAFTRSIGSLFRGIAMIMAVGACHGPPSGSFLVDASGLPTDAAPRDAAAPVDAPSDASLPVIDAAIADAGADAGMTESAAITLSEVTALVGPDFLGGREDDNVWGLGSGGAVGDVDDDGDLDIFLARCDSLSPPGGPSLLLINNGPSAGFADFAVDPAMQAAHMGTCAHSAAFGDIDRDGDLDLFVAVNGGDRLYRNDGAGAFTDIAAAAGVLGAPDDRNASVYMVDINHDGLLDIFVLGHTTENPPAPSPLDINRLYLNRGDNRFESVESKAAVDGGGVSQAAAIADLDNDGDLEIYVANDRYAVNGNFGTTVFDADQWLDPVFYDERNIPWYVDRSADFATDGMRSSMGVAVHDLDRDGRDDIFVSDWGSNHLQVWDAAAARYQDVAAAWNLSLTYTPSIQYQISWAVEFPDLDRDGREEFLLINGSVYSPVSCTSWSQLDTYMARDATLDMFEDMTGDIGWPTTPECPPVTDHPIAGRGAVLADLDGDGDDDLMITPWLEKYRFYRNDTPESAGHRLRLEPRGTVSAPTPHGAVLTVTRPDGVTIRRPLYAGGTQAQRYPVLEAGLAGHSAVTEAIVSWPSGYHQRIDLHPDFQLDATWRLVEPAWLTLDARAVTPADPAPVLLYRPVDQAGAFLGPAAAGRLITVTRADGLPVTVTDHGDGSYSAPLPHPGTPREVAVRIYDDGTALRPRFAIDYR